MIARVAQKFLSKLKEEPVVESREEVEEKEKEEEVLEDGRAERQ